MGQALDKPVNRETTKERVQNACSKIESLLLQSVTQQFNGSISLEVTVRQGTIQNVVVLRETDRMIF